MTIAIHMFIGFKDEKSLVQALAKIKGEKLTFATVDRYRAGELKVMGPAKAAPRTTIVSDIKENPESLFRVLLLAEALRRAGAKKLTLVAPWIAYGRQDRVTKKGEAPAGLFVARLLARAFDKIVTLDAHSPEFRAAFDGRLKNVLMTPACLPSGFRQSEVVVAPDYGAVGRVKLFARQLGTGTALVRKKRTAKGVKSFMALSDAKKIQGKRVLLVDDMTDSGATLAAASEQCRKAGALAVNAMVSHIVDSENLMRKYGGDFDGLQAGYNHKTGKLLDGIVKLLT